MSTEQIYRCIKYKRRGFNYYTDYMERYLEKAFAPYGKHIILDPSIAEGWIVSLEYEKPWVCLFSPEIMAMEEKAAERFAEEISEIFKTEAMVSTAPYDFRKSNDTNVFYLHSERSAATESFFIEEGPSKFKLSTRDCMVGAGRPAVFGLRNCGGPSEGLDVFVCTKEDPKKIFSEFELLWKKDEHSYAAEVAEPEQVTIEIGEDRATAFRYSFPSFKILPGINPYSRKYTGKKAFQLESKHNIVIRFVPLGTFETIANIKMYAVPRKNAEKAFGFRVGDSGFDNILPPEASFRVIENEQ